MPKALKRIYIQKQVESPKVDLNPKTNMLLFQGMAYLDNSLEFFKPLIDWVREYIEKLDTKAVLVINLSYLNTSSTKCMFRILDIFENAHKQGKDVEVKWYYEKGNEELLECAEEFKDGYEMTFNIIPD